MRGGGQLRHSANTDRYFSVLSIAGCQNILTDMGYTRSQTNKADSTKGALSSEIVGDALRQNHSNLSLRKWL